MRIPESLGLDVNDPLAFVTGLTFVGPSDSEAAIIRWATRRAQYRASWPQRISLFAQSPLHVIPVDGVASIMRTSGDSIWFAVTQSLVRARSR